MQTTGQLYGVLAAGLGGRGRHKWCQARSGSGSQRQGEQVRAEESRMSAVDRSGMSLSRAGPLRGNGWGDATSLTYSIYPIQPASLPTPSSSSSLDVPRPLGHPPERWVTLARVSSPPVQLVGSASIPFVVTPPPSSYLALNPTNPSHPDPIHPSCIPSTPASPSPSRRYGPSSAGRVSFPTLFFRGLTFHSGH